MKRRAVILLTEEDIERAVQLGDGERVHAIWPDPRAFGILVGVEGPGFAEVAEGADSPRIRRPLTFGVTSAFASCPAATGEATPACLHFPDGAHRCGRPRTHSPAGIVHRCTCDYGWVSATSRNGQLPIMMPEPVESGQAQDLPEETK